MLLGIFIGAILGVMTMCLVFCAKDREEENDRSKRICEDKRWNY